MSLVGNPNLEKPGDAKRMRILELCEKVVAFDPEFVLKSYNSPIIVFSALKRTPLCLKQKALCIYENKQQGLKGVSLAKAQKYDTTKNPISYAL